MAEPAPLDEPVIRFSLGKNRFDAYPTQREVETFDEFEEVVLNTRGAIKGLFYVCSAFAPDPTGKPRRGKEFALPTYWLSFDFDGIPGEDAFADLCLFLSQFRGFGYTTSSHTRDKPRARAILATDREMSREERLRISAYLEQKFTAKIPGLLIDTSVHRAEQPCFTPVFESQTFTWHGEPVEVEHILKTAPPAPTEGVSASANLVKIESSDPVLLKLRERGMIKRELGAGRFAVRCPCEHEHSGPSESETATVYTLPKFNGFDLGNFTCLHNHCSGRPQSQFIAALELDHKEVRAEQTKVEVDHSALIERMQAKVEVVETERRERFRFLTPHQLIKQQRVGWRVLDVIPKKGLVVMWGAPGSGKSFAAFDLGAAVARGIKYHGKRTKKGLVLIIAAEGDLTSRTMAYIEEHSLEQGELDNLMVLQRSINMLDRHADMDDLMEAINLILDSTGEELAMVIVDTLNRVMPGGNENASEDMGAVISNAKILEDAYQCAVMFVHHSGKDETKGSRGHSSLKGAMDAEISILRSEDIRTFRIEKQKEGQDYYDLFNFKLKTMDLGPMRDYDPDAEDHERLTSCVLEQTTETAQPKQVVTKNSGMLQAAILAAGTNSKEVVRIKYYEIHTGTQDSKKKAFQRDWARYMRAACEEGEV